MAEPKYLFTFLISSERSGSNFIVGLLNGHPAISAPPPTHLFRLFGNNIQNYGDLSLDANWNALLDDIVMSFEAKLGIWNTTITKNELNAKVTVRSAAELLKIIYEKEALSDRATHIFVKENQLYSFFPFIDSNFQNSRFLYLVRDPRDVASSYVKTNSIPGGVEKAVDDWVRDQKGSIRLYHQLAGSGKLLISSYENILANTNVSLKKILAFMGLDFEPSMLDYWKNDRTCHNASHIEAWGNLAKPIMHDNIGNYRKVLSEDDMRYIELSCHKEMAFLAYQPEMISAIPDSEELERDLKSLKPRLTQGNYVIQSKDEMQIRKRRLKAIDRVLNRKPELG
jgi:hypothetical protein